MKTCPTCGAPKPNDDWDWDKYDHRLVAAAPELLAACRLALDYFNETRNGREWRDNGGEEPMVLRKAINEAEGRVVMDFRQLFADPDDICESEYRAIYTTLEEVLPDAPEHEREGMCRGILESYVRSATEMLATLNRHAKAEGRDE